MSRPWMPLYISDYLGDTRRLKTLEHGAYLLLIMEYWQRGGLPNDDAELADIAGLDLDAWMAMRPRIVRLFQDGWRHKRVDAELAKAEAISERRSSSAKRRWSNAYANAEQEDSTCNANAEQEQCTRGRTTTTTTITDNPEIQDNPLDCRSASPPAPRKASRAKPRTAIADGQLPTGGDVEAATRAGLDKAGMIVQWQKFRDHHRAKGSLMADWSAAWRTWLGNMAAFQPRARAGPSPLRDNRNGVGNLLAEAYGLNGNEENHPPAVRSLPLIGDGQREPDRGDDGGVSRNPVELLIGNSFRRM